MTREMEVLGRVAILGLWLAVWLPGKAQSVAAASRLSEPDPGQLAELKRFHALLRLPSSEMPSPIRILFFGEAGTWGNWISKLQTNLVRRFPDRRFVITDHSMPAVPLDRLMRIADVEVGPMNPDLVVLHARGNQFEYERMVRRIRASSTADILLLTDPPMPGDDLNEESRRKVLDPMTAFPQIAPKYWVPWFSYSFLNRIARERHSACADIRTPWKDLLKTGSLRIEDHWVNGLLMNGKGEDAMVHLLIPWFDVRSGSLGAGNVDPWRNERVRTLRPGKEASWKEGSITFEFNGTRVDLVADSSSTKPIEVWIDGRRPSEVPESVRFTRTTYLPGTAIPAIVRIGSAQPGPAQTWILTVKAVVNNPPGLDFRITGFKTGEDGNGDSREDFISKSGQVVIQKQDWAMSWLFEKHGNPFKGGDVVVWNSERVGVDEWVPANSAGPNPKHDWTVTTVVQGLAPGSHTLTLRTGISEKNALKAVRIFRPAELPEKGSM